VSGNDMLVWFESDAATKLAVLYLDSFGNPRKFARTARQLGRTMPILAVNAGRSAKGKRLAAARAPATVPRPLTRQALFEQAGVIATANFGELLDAAALLASQPVPAGGRVAVVSNTRGGAILAADAWDDAGLQVARLAADTQRALRDVLPPGAAVATLTPARISRTRRYPRHARASAQRVRRWYIRSRRLTAHRAAGRSLAVIPPGTAPRYSWRISCTDG
jgi:acyl-CoA synthetase (NDP forming)